MRRAILFLIVLPLLIAPVRGQESLGDAARRKTFDQLLDLYVRNGDVYYRALRSDRAKLTATSICWPRRRWPRRRARSIAFAERLQRARAANGDRSLSHPPPPSIRPRASARPGAFERLPHRVAGRTLTLDQIEREVPPEFRDPRVYFALAAARPAAAGCAAKRSCRPGSRSSWPTSRPSASLARSA